MLEGEEAAFTRLGSLLLPVTACCWVCAPESVLLLSMASGQASCRFPDSLATSRDVGETAFSRPNIPFENAAELRTFVTARNA